MVSRLSHDIENQEEIGVHCAYPHANRDREHGEVGTLHRVGCDIVMTEMKDQRQALGTPTRVRPVCGPSGGSGPGSSSMYLGC